METKKTKAPAPVAAKPTAAPAVDSNAELKAQVEALEAKVNDLVKRLSKKMSF